MRSISVASRLNYWVIIRRLPNFQRIVVDRYHRRSDADGHLKILQQKVPDAEFELVFDVSDRCL